MTIGAIGAMSGVLAANAIYTRTNRVEQQQAVDTNRIPAADRSIENNSRLPAEMRFDRVEFDAEKLQSFASASSEENTLQVADSLANQDIVTNESKETAFSLEDTSQSMDIADTSSDEEMDFKAIRLIKESEIELPEPPTLEEIRERNAMTEEDSIAREEDLTYKYSSDSAIGRMSENQQSADEINSTLYPNLSAVENQNTPPTARDISESNLDISDSYGRLADRSNTRRFAESASDFRSYSENLASRMAERVETSASSNTSEEIARKSSQSNLTPAQNKGVEIYQRFQAYSNSLNLSYAATAV